MNTEEHVQTVEVEAGVIAKDLHCADCGYNLRTQSENGRCPECGLTVAQSLRFLDETTTRRANGRGQAALLMAISLGLWGIVALVMLVGVFFDTVDPFGDGTDIAQRAMNIVIVLFAGTSGMMLCIALLLALSASLHRDYANARRFLLAAAINPMGVLIVILIIRLLL